MAEDEIGGPRARWTNRAGKPPADAGHAVTKKGWFDLAIPGLPAAPVPVRFIGFLVLLALLLSVFVPALYETPPPNMSHAGLGILYWQYNYDSPVFFQSALRFPDYYQKDPRRASRPLPSLLTAPMASASRLFVTTFLPNSRAGTTRWDDHLAVEHLTIYYGWIGWNTVFLWMFLYFAAGTLRWWFGETQLRVSLTLLAISPPVLCTLTWLHTVTAGWLITALSLYVGLQVKREKSPMLLALLLGTLFLAKPQIALLVACCIVSIGRQTWREWGRVAVLAALPSLIWMAYCSWGGIQPTRTELGMIREVFLLEPQERLPLFLFRTLYQNGVGVFLLLSPLAVWYFLRSTGQVRWRGDGVGAILFLGLATFVEFGSLGRTGSIYLFSLFFLWLPLLVRGVGGDLERRSVTLLYSVQTVWLPIAVYLQLLLWRQGRWY